MNHYREDYLRFPWLITSIAFDISLTEKPKLFYKVINCDFVSKYCNNVK